MQKRIVTTKSIKVEGSSIPSGSFGHIENERGDDVKIYVESGPFDSKATAYSLWVPKSSVRELK